MTLLSNYVEFFTGDPDKNDYYDIKQFQGNNLHVMFGVLVLFR